MADDRYLFLGLATRHGGSWVVRRRFRRWSPRRVVALVILRRTPVRLLGFVAFRCVRRSVNRELDNLVHASRVVALGALSVVFALAWTRDRLPSLVASRLPGA